MVTWFSLEDNPFPSEVHRCDNIKDFIDSCGSHERQTNSWSHILSLLQQNKIQIEFKVIKNAFLMWFKWRAVIPTYAGFGSSFCVALTFLPLSPLLTNSYKNVFGFTSYNITQLVSLCHSWSVMKSRHQTL